MSSTITSFLSELYTRNRVYVFVGGGGLAVLVGCLVGLSMDTRLVLGIKPTKFSITIFVWTTAWVLDHLPDTKRSFKVVSYGIAGAMLVETGCIVCQSLRSVLSHFNRPTVFDGAVFWILGVAIMVSTLLTVNTLILLFSQKPKIFGLPTLSASTRFRFFRAWDIWLGVFHSRLRIEPSRMAGLRGLRGVVLTVYFQALLDNPSSKEQTDGRTPVTRLPLWRWLPQCVHRSDPVERTLLCRLPNRSAP